MNQDLITRLVSEDWRERRAAVEQIAQTGDEALANTVLEIVRSRQTDLSALSSALQVLEQIGRSLTPQLIGLLQEPDRDLHIYVSLVLGALGDPAAIPVLTQVAGDSTESDNARFNAIEAISRLKPAHAPEKIRQQVVTTLRKVLATDMPFLRYGAVLALGACADPALIPDLLPLLEDPYLSDPAITALGQLASSTGTPSGISSSVTQALTRWLNSTNTSPAEIETVVISINTIAEHASDPDSIRNAFIEAAGPQFPTEPDQEETRPSLRSRLLSLAQMPHVESCEKEDIVVGLARLFGWLVQSNPEDAPLRSALARLVRCPAARPLVAAALVEAPLPIPTELAQMLYSGNIEQSLSAARSLVEIAQHSSSTPHGAIGPALAEIFTSGLQSKDEMLATLCAEGLEALDPGDVDSQQVEAMVRSLALSSTRIRNAVIGALIHLQPAGMEQRIETWLDDPNPNLRESALRTLSAMLPRPGKASPDISPMAHPGTGNALAIGDRAAAAALAALVDPSPEVRRAAVELLPRFEDPQVVSALAQAMEDPDERTRINAVRACADLPPETALPLLNHAVQDQDHWVRMHAIRALSNLAQPESQPVIAFYLRDPFPPVRIAAIEALSRFQDPQARNHYLIPLLEDEDAEVRMMAQRVLEGGK